MTTATRISPEAEAAAGPSAPLTGGGSTNLRRILIGLDVLGALLAWVVALCVPDGLDKAGLVRLPNTLAAVALAVTLAVLAIGYQRLYLARECSVRSFETVRLGRAAVFVAVLLQAGERRLGVDLTLTEIGAGALLSFVFHQVGRDAFRAWLSSHRRQGRHQRPIVLIGANDEGLELYHLLNDHPELGYRVCGIIGDPEEFMTGGYEAPFLGRLQTEQGSLAQAVHGAGANGVLIATGALSTTELNRAARDLLEGGVHVHLSSGLSGIHHRRIRSHPLSHEPLFYLEPPSLSSWQARAKRGVDLALVGLGLVIWAPVLAGCALAIRIMDPGPVFFRQERVGRDGQTFSILKFRTMVVDAEARMSEVANENQRDGALFKMDYDPRITAVGRVLRATSLDELPQLINVVRGEMSLVGPRPALPAEVAQFDDELKGRDKVLPGITGLWQVEARDNASFRAYRRLDLFYVENWSVSLDCAILLATAKAVAARGLRLLRPRPASAAASLPLILG